jgi:uncharacterized RDD family membrane protein YckC
MEQAHLYDQSEGGVNVAATFRPSAEANSLRYASFWQRLGAQLVDMVILAPLIFGVTYLGNEFRLFHVYWFLPGIAFGLFYSVYLVHRYGGTPGKVVLKIRIALVDGSPVTMKAAVLRHSVMFAISIFSGITAILAALSISDEAYQAMGRLERMEVISDYAPSWSLTLYVLMQVWIWSEFITMLLNKRRRAIHDYIAGTVVVRTG